MEGSECKLCFRHSWIQKLKCDHDLVFVNLSVSCSAFNSAYFVILEILPENEAPLFSDF